MSLAFGTDNIRKNLYWHSVFSFINVILFHFIEDNSELLLDFLLEFHFYYRLHYLARHFVCYTCKRHTGKITTLVVLKSNIVAILIRTSQQKINIFKNHYFYKKEMYLKPKIINCSWDFLTFFHQYFMLQTVFRT